MKTNSMEVEASDVHRVNVFNLHDFLGKYVQIKLKSWLEEIWGVVYTIDPITENVVLLTKGEEGDEALVIVMKIAMKEIAILEDIKKPAGSATDISQLFASPPVSTTMGLTQAELVEWLTLSQIPFSQAGEVIDVEGVTIAPPYNSHSCRSNNPTKLLRLQVLLDSIPRSVPKIL